ncbi:MAG TPA: Fe-Mn family superoxide dismutase [Rhabdochlamydiaceae bacterium]|jgi:Fe-Mn family superoxide dismutase|nr:Fe-Mn family superoxide dismutase [Rhabdochlamydiaceae bacterium]
MRKKNWVWAVCFLFFSTTLIGYFAQPPGNKEGVYQLKDYSSLLGMEGFSDKALATHFKLYQGYVTNTNLLYRTLSDLAGAGKNRSPEYAEIKRRFGWEFDGMRLHEAYFDNLGGKGSLNSTDPLYAQLVADFGSYEKWKADFIAIGAMRGIGWAVLYLDPQSGKLFNTWINEHDLGHLAGGRPILVMDVFEHAYMIDYLLDRAAYIDAFFKNIHWEIVEKRYMNLSQ